MMIKFIIFAVLNVPDNGVDCEPFTIISTDSLLVRENNYYLQISLNNCAYNIAATKMPDYLGNNLFETDEN